MTGQILLWDLDEWTPELRSQAIQIMEAWIMEAWIATHGGA